MVVIFILTPAPADAGNRAAELYPFGSQIKETPR